MVTPSASIRLGKRKKQVNGIQTIVFQSCLSYHLHKNHRVDMDPNLN